MSESTSSVVEQQHPYGGNRLLAAFPSTVLHDLSKELRPVLFHAGDVLFERGTSSEVVFFPKTGVISLVLTSSVGIDVEVGLVGFEGMIGVSDALTGSSNMVRAQIQIPGSGWKLPSVVLREAFANSPEVQTVLLSYQRTLAAMHAQNTLCNRLHTIEQRLAKWLLLVQDRDHSVDLALTHEFLADMLGARRAAVTLAAQSLREIGVIDYRRGSITILDRSRLEHIACECYAVLRSDFDSSP